MLALSNKSQESLFVNSIAVKHTRCSRLGIWTPMLNLSGSFIFAEHEISSKSFEVGYGFPT